MAWATPQRSRIPQPLWTLAVELVRRHGVSRTAIALGLDYYQLKRRAAATAAAPSGPTFVELTSEEKERGKGCQDPL
jgi:hypothetical protein